MGRRTRPRRPDRSSAYNRRRPGFLELGAVAGETAGQRDFRADHAGDARHQLAAVDVEAVGQNEDAGEVVGGKPASDRFAAGARMRRRRHRLAGQCDPGPLEAERHRGNLVVDVVVTDLAAGAAAHDVGIGEHRAELLGACAIGERRAQTEIQNEIGVGVIRARRAPTLRRAPRQLMRTHRSASLRASGKSALKLGFTNENRVSGICHNSLIINRIWAPE
jgi:hypothetical protein